jgi:hypothetical protein
VPVLRFFATSGASQGDASLGFQGMQVERCGIPHPRFPVKVGGSREPYAPFLKERRIRCLVQCSVQEIRASREERARYGVPSTLLRRDCPILSRACHSGSESVQDDRESDRWASPVVSGPRTLGRTWAPVDSLPECDYGKDSPTSCSLFCQSASALAGSRA